MGIARTAIDRTAATRGRSRNGARPAGRTAGSWHAAASRRGDERARDRSGPGLAETLLLAERASGRGPPRAGPQPAVDTIDRTSRALAGLSVTKVTVTSPPDMPAGR